MNFLTLKDCTLQEINHVINYLNKKYTLKKKIYGWRILAYIEGMIKNVFTETNDFVWSNFYVYK